MKMREEEEALMFTGTPLAGPFWVETPITMRKEGLRLRDEAPRAPRASPQTAVTVYCTVSPKPRMSHSLISHHFHSQPKHIIQHSLTAPTAALFRFVLRARCGCRGGGTVPGTVRSFLSLTIGALDPSNEARSAPALLAPAGSKLAAAQSRDLPSARAATAATSYCAYTNCEAHDRHVVSPNASATQPRHRGVAKPI